MRVGPSCWPPLVVDPHDDVVISDTARAARDILPPAILAQFEDALTALRADPSSANPYVTELSWFPYQPGTYALVWGTLMITYRMPSQQVEILAVQVIPELKPD